MAAPAAEAVTRPALGTTTAAEQPPVLPGRRFLGLWWLSPVGVVLLIVPVTLGLAVIFTPEDFITYFRSPKRLTTSTALLFAQGAGVLVLGALLAQSGRAPERRSGRWPWFSERQLRVLERSATVLFRVTLLGYAAFVVAAARNGVRLDQVVTAIVQQDVFSGELERAIGTVPGITTLTQVGVAYAVVAVLLLMHGRDRRNLRRLAVLLGLTALRAFVLTERLAVVEIALPVVALLALRLADNARPRRLLLVAAPLPLVLLLIVGFGATEYSRSYQFFKERTDDGIVMFSLKRLGGYYATAYNNGQISLDHDRYPGRLPYTSLEALWTAPGIENLDLYDRLAGRDTGEQYVNLLQTYGNPEFNNPGGLPSAFVDFGRTGGLVFLFGVGLATGWGYRRFVHGDPAGVLLYPVAMIGLFELPRFLYWTLGRTVPIVLALLLVLRALHRSTRSERMAAL